MYINPVFHLGGGGRRGGGEVLGGQNNVYMVLKMIDFENI